MYRKAFLGLLVSSLLTCGLQAQSSSRSSGSSSYSRGSSSNTAAMKAKAKGISTIAKKIQKEQFAAITLDRNQRNTLEQLVGENLQQMTSLTSQIGKMIPADKVRKLQRSYNVSKKNGANETEAMQESMTMIELAETTQEKILVISNKKMELEKTIATSLTDSLSDEQKATLAAAMKMKEAEMTEESGEMKDKMMDEKSETQAMEETEKKAVGSQSR